MRKLLTIGALALVAALIGAAPASATYPGRNGLIAYEACSSGGGCEEGLDGIGAVSPDGTGYHLLVASSEVATPLEPAWSPSGQRLAYAVRAADQAPALGGIYVANADGSNPRQLTSGSDENPTFSPSGKRIAFDEHGSIIEIKLDGSVSTVLNQGGHSTSPAYSPDGKWIAYTRWHRQIWLMHRNGSDPHLLAHAYGYGGPDWSPDGKHLVFNSDRGGLRIVRADGSGARDIQSNSFAAEPAYSPDGRSIAFTDGETPTSNPIGVVGTHGRGLRWLGGPSGFVAAWQPLPPGATTG